MTDDSDPVGGSTYDQVVTAGAQVLPGTDPGLTVNSILGESLANEGLGIATMDARMNLLIPASADAGDYAALTPLFADDAELVDPIYGTFVGGEAIAGFFTMMNTEMAKAGASFRLVELSGDDQTAWAQWEATTNKGVRHGVGVYRVRNGQLTYYKDYMNP